MTALNTNPSRRVFIMQAMVASGGVLTAQQVAAQAALAESDAQAVALGYKSDASKVDKAKQTRYAAGQVCSNCALFQAASGAAAGACPLFAGQQEAVRGWCTAWAKKA